jgi:hypothetical protein
MIYSGIHGIRQIQRKRFVRLAQLERLQRRRAEGLRRRRGWPRRRQPEVFG